MNYKKQLLQLYILGTIQRQKNNSKRAAPIQRIHSNSSKKSYAVSNYNNDSEWAPSNTSSESSNKKNKIDNKYSKTKTKQSEYN